RSGASLWLAATWAAQRDQSVSSDTATAVPPSSQVRKRSTDSRMRSRWASPWAAPSWAGGPDRSRTGMVGCGLAMNVSSCRLQLSLAVAVSRKQQDLGLDHLLA